MRKTPYLTSTFTPVVFLCLLLSGLSFGQSVKGKTGNRRAGSKNPANSKTGGAIIAENNIDPRKIRDWSQAQENARPYVEEKANGTINWTGQFIEAKGEAVIDNERFKNPAQARLMAQRGAVVVAQRNLLEIVKGVNVSGETSVEDMITTRDYIYTRIDGVIKGAQMVNEPVVKDGVVQVRMRIALYEGNGLAQAIHDEIPAAEESANGGSNTIPAVTDEKINPVNPENGKETLADTSSQSPVLFNITNPKDWKPSMFPVITDESGNVVLDLTAVYDPSKGKFPKILGITKEIFDAAGWKNGARTIDLVAGKDGKLVIPNSRKGKFNWNKILKTVADIGRFVFKLL